MSLFQFFRNHLPSGVETVAPISKLPDELLLEIFDNIKDWNLHMYQVHRLLGILDRNEDERLSVNQLHKLAGVCKRWYTIIVSTPTLFRTLDYHGDSQTNALILKKNHCGPLDVRIPYGTYYERRQEGFSEISLSEFLKECCRHAARWEGVDIDIGDAQEVYFPILQEALEEATRLKSFALRMPSSFSIVHLPHTTSLRLLSLEGPSLSLSTHRFQNLRYLSLTPHNGPAIVEQLPSILRTTLELEELRLDGQYLQTPHTNGGGGGAFDNSQNGPILSIEGGAPIPLNHLKVLRVRSIPAPCTRALLDSMVAPALELLVITNLEHNAFDPIVSPNCRVLLACVTREASRIVLTFEGKDWVILSSEERSQARNLSSSSTNPWMEPSRGFKIMVRGINTTSWEPIATFLETVQDIPLHVKLMRWETWSNYPTAEWPEPSIRHEDVVRSLPWAAKLTFWGVLQAVADTLHGLGNEDTPWFLPQLQELEIHGIQLPYNPTSDGFVLAALKSAIQRRDARSDVMRIEKLVVRDAAFAKALREEMFDGILYEDLLPSYAQANLAFKSRVAGWVAASVALILFSVLLWW